MEKEIFILSVAFIKQVQRINPVAWFELMRNCLFVRLSERVFEYGTFVLLFTLPIFLKRSIYTM